MNHIRINNFVLSENLYGQGFPKNISLEVTNDCNLKCCHCFRNYYDFHKGHFPCELFDKLKSEINKAEGIQLSSSGEPLISPSFRSCFKWIQKEKIPISFTTNGILLHTIQDLLFDGNISITLSIDAASENLYKKIRGASYKKLRNNLEVLKSVKLKRNDGFPRTSITSVVWLDNFRELPNIIKLANEFMIDNVICYHRIFYDVQNFEKQSLFFHQTLFDAVIDESRSIAANSGVNFIHSPSFDGAMKIPGIEALYLKGTVSDFDCQWIESNMTVAYNGIVFACCYADKLGMGSAWESTLKDIWNGPAYRKLRWSIRTRQYCDACRKCMFRQSLSVQDSDIFLSPITETMLFSEKMIPSYSYSVQDINFDYLQALKSIRCSSYSQGLLQLSAIMQKEPLCHEALNAMGVIYGLLNNKEAAIQYFRNAGRIFPEYSPAASNLEMIKSLL